MTHYQFRNYKQIIFLFLLFGCNPGSSSKGRPFEEEYYSNGHLKGLALPRSDGAVQIFSFDTLGNCTDLLTSKNRQMEGEQLWFYPNGFLKQKTGYKEGKPDGFLYQYYSSGAIKSSRFSRNGIEKEFGLEYYDTHIGITKATVYINDSGMIYFKQNFDSSGNLLSEEGQKPKSLK